MVSVLKLRLRPEAHGFQPGSSGVMDGPRQPTGSELDTTPAEASFRPGTELLTTTLEEVHLPAFKI